MALDGLVIDERQNAAVGWLMTGIVALAGVESLLSGALLWGGFSAFVVSVAAFPALATREWTAMVPWPLLTGTAIAMTAQVAAFYTELAGYLIIAIVALVVVVEIDVFTPVELSRRFAVAFAVLTTLALEALWIVAQFYSDAWLDTDFLGTQTELQRDIVAVTVVGFAVGGCFYWYLSRVDRAGAAVDSPSRGEAP